MIQSDAIQLYHIFYLKIFSFVKNLKYKKLWKILQIGNMIQSNIIQLYHSVSIFAQDKYFSKKFLFKF